MSAVAQAFSMVFEPYTIMVMVIASLYGLFVGAVPGLTATMATALLVPVTFFMPPIPAIAAMVTATAMAIFSGDIPGCLLRIPGTPASAAYTDEAYAMTRKGEAEKALGAGLVFSAVGGLFGTLVLIVAAPALADFALNFSSFEYFWLVLLGLTCAVFITSDRPLKGVVTLLLGGDDPLGDALDAVRVRDRRTAVLLHYPAHAASPRLCCPVQSTSSPVSGLPHFSCDRAALRHCPLP